MNEKMLVENRNDKVTKMEAILTLAKDEERELSEEETEMFNSLEKEVQGIDKTLALNEKLNNLTQMKKTTSVSDKSQKEVDNKVFENIIRGIQNTDYPTTKTEMGVLIPTTIWDRIIDRVIEISPILQRADVYRLGGKLVFPVEDTTNTNLQMAYADEGTNADSGKVAVTSVELNGYLARCLAKVSLSLVNNTQFDVVGYVIAKMAQKIAIFCEHELQHGTQNKVTGLSNVPAGMIVTTASTSAITGDELMDLQDKVVDNYQANSIWVMNRTTRNAIRKLKDNKGDYLLNRDLTSKWGYVLLGKDVYCSDDMDEIGAGKFVIYYGDLSGLAVKFSEDANLQVLRERYAVEHQLGLLNFIEFDAKVVDTQKIAKMVMASA